MALWHDGGMTSHVAGNWARQGDVGSRFRVDGAAATLVVPDDDGQTARLTAGGRPSRREPRGAPSRRAGGAASTAAASPSPCLRREATGARSTPASPAPSGGWTASVDPWDAVAALEVLDAARTAQPHVRWSCPAPPAGRDEGIENRSGHPPSRPTPSQRDHLLVASHSGPAATAGRWAPPCPGSPRPGRRRASGYSSRPVSSWHTRSPGPTASRSP